MIDYMFFQGMAVNNQRMIEFIHLFHANLLHDIYGWHIALCCKCIYFLYIGMPFGKFQDTAGSFCGKTLVPVPFGESPADLNARQHFQAERSVLLKHLHAGKAYELTGVAAFHSKQSEPPVLDILLYFHGQFLRSSADRTFGKYRLTSRSMFIL